MPAVTVTATTTTQIALKPQLRRKLLVEMKAYGVLAEQVKVLKLAMRKHSTTVEEIICDVGESKLELEGWKATLVAGVSKTLNKKKLSPAALAEVNAAYDEVPKKPYVKITAPGESGGNEYND